MRSLAFAAATALATGAARADSLTAIIDDRAATGLPADVAITAVHLSARQAAIDVAPDTVDIEFPAVARPGRASLRVRIAGRRSMFVPVTLAALADVPVASRDLAAGELITDADVTWELRPVTGAAPQLAVGAVVASPIAAGDVIDDARVTAPPPVARGAEVEVVVVRGAVEIVTRGHLEQAARVGARARVRLAGGAFASGVLASRDRVLVEAP